MRVSTPAGGIRAGISMLGLCLLANLGPARSVSAEAESGTLEKLIVASGRVTLDLDLQKIREQNALVARKAAGRLLFGAEKDSFMTYIVFNGELRGPLPGSMRLLPQEPMSGLPTSLEASRQSLVVENTAWGSKFDMVVRDGTSGFLFFNVEGHTFAYEPGGKTLRASGGRLLVSEEFAQALGRPSAAGTVAGELTIEATMRPIEVSQVVDGEVREDSLPGLSAALGGVPGPDVIVGDLSGLAQFGGASGTQVGLAVGTDSCNAGVVPLNWFALPSNDHPVIPQNLYRMSGGTTNDRTFEQIGQSNVKHAFTALQQNLCGFGCSATGGTTLGAGCSDPYTASLNSGPNLGSRAWINPFTGFYPSGTNVANSHVGHSHVGPSHRILTQIADLNTSLNPGATYYAEAQYVTPHEYAWCQGHTGECNMYNNVSYRRYNVSGTASPFSFSAVGSTVRMQPAINAWPGATIVQVEPAPGLDGRAYVAYKVTNPSPGVWHYEYALYNYNLDRGIQGLSFPKPAGVTLSNVGFHAPPQHPGWAADGTVGNTGYSSTPWAMTEADGQVAWGSQTFTQNPNANAVRWGSMYNIRFDANTPPVAVTAALSFFKVRAKARVSIQVPSAP